MAKNLKSKLFNLIDDLETLGKYEKARKLESFINEELQFLETEHAFDAPDLIKIRSLALKTFNDRDARTLSKGSDTENFLTFCYLDSIIRFLRDQGLISFTLKEKE